MNSQFIPDRFQQNNIVPPTSDQQHGQHYPSSNDQLSTSDRYIGQQSNQDLRPPMNGTQNYSNDSLQFTKPTLSSSNIPNNMHSLTNDMNQLNCGSDLNQNQPTPMVSAFSPQPQKSFSSDPSHVQSNNSEGFPMTYNKIQHNGSTSNQQNIAQFSEDKLNRSADSNSQNGPQSAFHSQQLEGTKHQEFPQQLSNVPPENTFESKVIQNVEFQSQHSNFSQHQVGFQTQESSKPLQQPGFPTQSKIMVQQGFPPKPSVTPLQSDSLTKPSAALQQLSFPPQSSSTEEQPGFSPQASSASQQQGFSNSNLVMQKSGFSSDANSISQQPGFPPQPSSLAVQQQGFPPNSNSASQKPGFPLDVNTISQQPGFPPQPSSASQQQGFPPNSNSTMHKPGFPPQPNSFSHQSGFPPQPISAPQQQGFPSQPNSILQQPGFPPQPISVPQQKGFPSQPNSISQQPGFPPQPVAASQQQGFPQQSNSTMQKPGFPPQPNLISHQSGLPPQSTLPSQQGFPPQHSSTPQQSGFSSQSNSETQKTGYPSLPNSIPQHSGFQPQQPGFPPQQLGFPPQANPTPQQSGFPPPSSSGPLQTGPHSKSNLSSNQPGFPPQPNLTAQQSGYPTKQPGFLPQSSTASQNSGVGIQSSLPPQQPGFPTQANLNTQNPEFPPVSNLSQQRQGFPPQPNSTIQQSGFPSQPSAMQRAGFPPQPSAMQQPGFPPQPNSTMQQSGFPSQPSALQQPGFPPQPSAMQQPGFPPQPSAMQQPGFPPQPSAMQQPGFPPQPSAMQQPGFPPQPSAMQQPGFPPQPQGFPPQPVPSQQPGLPPQGFPQPQGNFAPQQQGYPSQQLGYPPNQQTGTPAYMGQPAPNRRLDPDQMPSPVQVMEDDQHSKGGVFLTNQRGLVPPLVTTDFTVQDGGNASPRLIRSTMYCVPTTTDIMKQTSVPFGLVISPMAKMKYDEYSPPIINTGDVGPVRCKRCKAYMSPLMQFIDGGKHFVCLLCKATTEVPVEYFQHLDHTGQRLDRSERPELCFGSYEFIVPKEYCRKEIQPKPPAYVFVIDVSYNNVKSGLVRLICSYMKELLTQLPTELGDEKSKIRVGFITYDTTIHFYNIKETLVVPQMMVVGDTTEMFMPLLDGFLCDPEKSSHVIDALMEQISIQFNETRTTETVLYPAIKAGIEALKNADCCGKLFVFHSSLPIAEAPGKLKNREDRKLLATDKEKSVLNPQTSVYKELGEECVQVGCGVDLFVTNNSYIDLATIGQVSRISGGEIFKYTYFQAEFDGKRFLSDLKRDISRATVFDAVMRVRTSTGVRPTDFYGHFNMSNATDVELGAIDCDKAIAIEVKHDDKLDEQDGVLIQTAMLYTSCSGQRRVRILNLSLRSSGEMGDLYRSCDLDTVMNFFGKQVMYKILESSGRQVKDAIINKTAQILACYRKHCASPTSAGQLILPECMKLMPLYLNCLIKSDAMSGGPDMTVDDRWYNMHLVITADIPTTLGYFYPRLIPIHTLENETNLADVAIPCQLRCSIEKLSENGAYILENGVYMFLWLGLGLSQTFLTDVFGVTSCSQVNTERTDIPVIDNPLNKAVRQVISKIQDERSHAMRLSIIRQRDKIEIVMRHFLVEDHIDNSSSYVEFLCHMHKEIRNLLS